MFFFSGAILDWGGVYTTLYETVPAPSKGCCLNPKGWCIGTLHHPFSTLRTFIYIEIFAGQLAICHVLVLFRLLIVLENVQSLVSIVTQPDLSLSRQEWPKSQNMQPMSRRDTPVVFVASRFKFMRSCLENLPKRGNWYRPSTYPEIILVVSAAVAIKYLAEFTVTVIIRKTMWGVLPAIHNVAHEETFFWETSVS